MSLEPIDIPGVSNVYRVAGELLCRVVLARPVDAAADMYGCLATAIAIDDAGDDLPGARGTHTEAVHKTALVADPASVVAAIADRATRAAVAALVTERAVQAANAAAGI